MRSFGHKKLSYNYRMTEFAGALGLECLKNTYDKNSIIAHSLDHYISIIELQIANVKKPQRMDNMTESTLRVDLDDKEQKKREVETNNRIYKLLRELWSEREILIVFNLLLELETLKTNGCDKSELDSLISSLDSILIMKEQKVNQELLNYYFHMFMNI